MPLNIKNPSVERLVDEAVRLTGESKTEAIRKALEERRERLTFRVTGQRREERLRRLLEQEIWPIVPKDELGRSLSRAEEEETLGYGPEGV
jgi:antitoxin VapB